MSKEIVKAGQIRLQIYTMIQEITGRDLTETEHASLKAMLNDFKNTVAPVVNPAPIEHTYTCVECGGKKRGYGKNFNNRMKRIRPPKKDE